MFRKIIFSISCFFLSQHLLGRSTTSIEALAKLSSSLRESIENETSGTSKNQIILVYLKEQANLAPAESIADRVQRITFVYDALRQTAETSQKELRDFLKTQQVAFKPYYITNMIVVHDANADLILKIASRTDVLRVVSNPRVKGPTQTSRKGAGTTPTSNSRAFVAQDNIAATGAEKVWKEFNVTGQNIVVAGQDTGVEFDHPALVKQYRGLKSDGTFDHSYSWHDAITSQFAKDKSSCGYNTTAPCDDGMHGTHTMGTMVGDDGRGNKIGMAPDAKWIACRNMDNGLGSPQTYIDCFQFFLAPFPMSGDPFKDGKPEMAPHIINNSWTCPLIEGCDGTEFIQTLKALRAAGIMVVVSAGNNGPACGTLNSAPAFYMEDVFVVGNYYHLRTEPIGYSSARGPSTFNGRIGPDLVAPGIYIRSAIPGKTYNAAVDSGSNEPVITFIGTSMSSPHVAGSVALLWSYRTSLIGKISETANLLRQAATPRPVDVDQCDVKAGVVPNNVFGYGVLNIYSAITKK